MAIYHIAKDGDDSDPGTLAQPWLTIGKANGVLVANDLVNIRVGTYDERIIPANSGSSSNRIVYQNYQDEVVTIRGVVGQQAIVKLHNRAYITVDGFKITHTDDILNTKFGWIQLAFSGCHHCEILNNTIERLGDQATLYADGYREFGIVVAGTTYNIIRGNHIRGHYMGIDVDVTAAAAYLKIQGNTITETGNNCIVIERPSSPTILGILIEDNVLERSYMSDGVQCENSTDDNIRGVIIRNNKIRRNAENAVDLKGTRNIVVEGNLIYGTIGSDDGPLSGWNRNSFQAIMRGSGAVAYDNIIRNNILYDNAAGIRSYGGYRLYNNTLVSDNRDWTGPDSQDAAGVWQGVRQFETDIRILNNIFVGHYTHEVSLNMGAGTYIDYNLYYNSDGELFEDRSVPEDLAWAAWRTRLQAEANVTGEDEHSVVGDPLFTVAPEHPQWNVTEYVKDDFRPRPNSPAVGAAGALTHANGGGTGTSITVDDARFFFDGYGITDGDSIIIGACEEVEITAINYTTNVLTLANSRTWSDNDAITLDTDNAANIGALETAPSQVAICMII